MKFLRWAVRGLGGAAALAAWTAGAVAEETAPSTRATARIAPTLAEQIARSDLKLNTGYASARPRLLYGAVDRDALRAKAERLPTMWAEVLRKARATRPDNAPSAENIEAGRGYWHVERIQSAALAAWLFDDDALARGAIAWMRAHARVPVWGNEYRPNRDLQAAWNLYHIAIGYDTLHERLSAEERAEIRGGLVSHAHALDEGLNENEGAVRYDQNHAYIPAVALTAAALALLGEAPEAEVWLRRATATMVRSRYVLGEDGWYYEGTGYWIYALHWHVRWAELMERAAGASWMNLPVLRENWRYALHLSLPGPPNFFDIGDTAVWRDPRRPTLAAPNASMLRAVARSLRSAEAQYAGNEMYRRFPEMDYPAAAFLWLDDTLAPADPATIAPYHVFEDHGAVAWRSGWGADDTIFLFRCGPPQGHAATAKLKVLRDWTMNSGHVHPDIGAFWMYSGGRYLAVDTGYLAEKWTAAHNTLLVGGRGQGIDGSYWNDRGMDYARFDRVRLLTTRLTPDYGFARGEFSSIYPSELGLRALRRAVVMRRDSLLVADEMAASSPQTLTWICHSDTPFEAAEAGGFLARGDGPSLAVLPLGPASVVGGGRRTVIVSGTSPRRGVSLETIHHLRLETPALAEARLATLLTAIGPKEAPPQARLIEWNGDRLTVEIVRGGRGPERIEVALDTGVVQIGP